MKRFVALFIVAVLALAVAGVAEAITPRQLAIQTTQVTNKRLVFMHAPFRVTGVRCEQDSPTFFFCTGKVTSLADSTISQIMSWNVTIANGNINWSRAR